MIQVISTAVMVGLLWWNSNASSSKRGADQDEAAGLLFFISVFWAFFPVFTAIFTFPQERAMLAKERSVDMYKLSAYLIARNMSDLPLDLLLPVIFLLVIYFMVGLTMNFSAFSLTLLSIFLTIIAAQVPLTLIDSLYIYIYICTKLINFISIKNLNFCAGLRTNNRCSIHGCEESNHFGFGYRNDIYVIGWFLHQGTPVYVYSQ